jgi:glycyl-tRNA synthetase
VLKLQNDLPPSKVAVPLSRNEKLVPKAKEVFDVVEGQWMCDDDAGSIGRRYRRQDEVVTPFCVTVDFESLEDNQPRDSPQPRHHAARSAVGG